MLPLLALTLKRRDLRLRGDDLRLACHRAVVSAVGQALPLAGDLARAAARLRAVAPKLRAKAAGRAVDLFLSRDALVPGALAFMSDRAARRLAVWSSSKRRTASGKCRSSCADHLSPATPSTAPK